MKKIFLVFVLFISHKAFAFEDLTQKEKIFICAKALSKLNMNESSDYKFDSKFNSVLNFYSKKNYPYQCTVSVFSKEDSFWNIELWSPPDESGPGWGSIKPLGKIHKKNECLYLSIDDVALNRSYREAYCDKIN